MKNLFKLTDSTIWFVIWRDETGCMGVWSTPKSWSQCLSDISLIPMKRGEDCYIVQTEALNIQIIRAIRWYTSDGATTLRFGNVPQIQEVLDCAKQRRLLMREREGDI